MFTVSGIAELVEGEVVGDGRGAITGIAPAEAAGEGDLTFAEKESYLAAAEQSLASAVIVPEDVNSARKVLIRVKNPRAAMAAVLPLFHPPEQHEPGIDPSASIDATAQIDPSASIGPHCIIEAEARVGKRTVLAGNNAIGRAAQIGDDVVLQPNVVVYALSQIGDRVIIHAGTAIGSDGYGYVFDQGRHRKILQLGYVMIGNDVEIGANTAIDRGAFGATVIGEGTKIDNLVHIAHNVEIGRHCLILGQVGFAGSTRVGDYAVVASQSGIAGHLKIGSGAMIGAKSGVMRDVGDGEAVLGYPAAPGAEAKRQWASVVKLPEVIRRLRQVENQLKRIEADRIG